MENIGSNEVVNHDSVNIEPLKEEFYRLFNSYSEEEFMRLYFDITSNRVKPSHKIKKLIRLKNKILTLNQGWLHNALYEELKTRRTSPTYKVFRFSPQGYLLQALLNIELQLKEEKRTLPPQFPITPIDRTTAQDLLPVLMNRGIFSGYITLLTSEEIINKEKQRLNKVSFASNDNLGRCLWVILKINLLVKN